MTSASDGSARRPVALAAAARDRRAGTGRGRRGGDRHRPVWRRGESRRRRVVDNASATSLATVKRQSLSQQTQVSGTLGYAGSSSIRVPSGTAPSAVQQASQQVASAEAMLASGLRDAGHRHAGARRPPGDAGGGAREGGGGLCGRGRRGSRLRRGLACKRRQLAGARSSCSSDVQAVSSAQQNATGAAAKLTRRPLTGLLGRKTARERAVQFVHGAFLGRALRPGSTFTALPSVGEIIGRGQSLYEIDGQPVLLLYGSSPPTRAFVAGMSPGPRRGRAEREPRRARLRARSRGRRIHHRHRGGDSRAAVRARRLGDRRAARWDRSCSSPGRCASRA